MTYTAEQQKANRDKWVAALRSGEFRQTIRILREDNSYCCLGVACELAAQEGVIPRWNGVGYDTFMSVLPRTVQNWLGLTDDLGVLKEPVKYDDNNCASALTELNDEAGWDFEQIAKIVADDGVVVQS